MTRSRKKKKKTRKSRYHRGTHTSAKAPGKEFKYRSGWEAEYFRILDSDPNVISYDYECIKIPYVSNKKSGKVRNYVPDFLVNRASSTTIVEIKPSRFLSKLAITKKINAGREYARANGLLFQVITEVDLRTLGAVL